MKTFIIAASALMIASPAFAQMSPTAPSNVDGSVAEQLTPGYDAERQKRVDTMRTSSVNASTPKLSDGEQYNR